MYQALKPKKQARFIDRDVFEPGQTIVHEGSDGYCAFIVETGLVEVVKDRGGEETVLGTLGKGAIFGEMALIDGAPHMADVRALDWTVTIAIKGSTFRRKIAEADPFIAKLLRILVGHARSAAAQLVEFEESAGVTALEEPSGHAVKKTGSSTVVFEDLARLSPGDARTLIHNTESGKLAIALKGASDTIRDLFLSNMPERAAKILREEMDAKGTIRIKDVDDARMEIVSLAQELAQQGDILLMEERDDGDLVP